MNRPLNLRTFIGLLLLVAMLSPTAVLAIGNGKKYFREGLKHEAAEEWDLAAEKFTLAVNENPKNPEYRLHLRRALFNASQMYMQKGRALAQEKDYEGAYVAYRKAYAFDPVNELARSEMARMLRLQEAVQKGLNPDPNSNGEVRLVPTSAQSADERGFQMPQRLEKLRDVSFPSGVNLQVLIKELAKELDLNVLFESESRLETRTVRIDLKSVTPAKALDYIFLQENLFFQRVGPRTILVANSQSRSKFQQLVLRTFYLANAAPKEVKAVIQAAIPVQPGRAQTIVLEDEATNSITVRDTAENIKLIERLIGSLDKDRAEVVMDVAIYEVNKSDLLQFGNQVGTTGPDGTLLNIGGVALPFLWKGASQPVTGGMPFPNPGASGFALGLPVSNIVALQTKSDTKLLASTQIHAFNNQDSSARIGQRVPVRTASFAPVSNTGTNNPNNNFVGDVINYEQVGLTLKFKPIVFPNQDVQVQMEIESKDVAGALTDTPVFTERTIKGTARVQNNKTLLLASVAQGVENKGRSGLPLLGLIPILGRLFTAPTRDNRQIDLVIAVTPRVIRAPAILPEDEVERPTGSVAVPTSSSLEAMIIQEEKDEYLASARRLSNTAQVQLPDQPVTAPAYVRTDTAAVPATQASASSAAALPAGVEIKPIDSGTRTLDLTKTANTFAPVESTAARGLTEPTAASSAFFANVRLDSPTAILKKGERTKIAIQVEAGTAFRSAVLGLRFDEKLLNVRSVSFGDVFGPALAGGIAQPFLNQNGRTFVSLAYPGGSIESTSGVLAVIEVEALVDGVPAIALEREVLNFLTADGKNLAIRF